MNSRETVFVAIIIIGIVLLGFVSTQTPIANPHSSLTRSFINETGPRVEIYPPLKDISIHLNKQVFSSGDNLVLRIFNNGSEPVSFGEPYVVQYFHNSKWIVAKWLTPDVWIAIAYILKTGESHDQEISLLPVLAGTYRVLKEVTPGVVGVKLGDRGTVMATFQVSQGTPVDKIPRAHLTPPFWSEFYSFCANQVKGDGRKVIDMILWFIGNHTSSAENIQFLGYGTNYESVLIHIKHATMDFVQSWPSECQGVHLEIYVEFWALTEPRALED